MNSLNAKRIRKKKKLEFATTLDYQKSSIGVSITSESKKGRPLILGDLSREGWHKTSSWKKTPRSISKVQGGKGGYKFIR